jgi:hypothetical protein
MSKPTQTGRSSFFRALRPKTIAEVLVIVAVVGILASLFLPAVNSGIQINEEDLELDKWKPGPEHDVLPHNTVGVQDMDVTGQWTYRWRPTFGIDPRTDGGYSVKFVSNHRCTHCELQRTATYEQGVLTLDRPVKEIAGPTYQKLYTVRIDGEDCLLPAARSEEFEQGRADDWSRSHSHDLLDGIVLRRIENRDDETRE